MMSRKERDVRELIIRHAEIDDVVKFNALINSLGRTPFFKAIFGAFNFTNITEFNYLSLIATVGDGEDSAIGFISINDSIVSDLSYDQALDEIHDYLPVHVST